MSHPTVPHISSTGTAASVIFDSAGRIVALDSAAAALFCCDARQAVGQRLDSFVRSPGAATEEPASPEEARGPTWQIARLRSGAGEIPIHIRTSLLTGAGEQPLQLVTLSVDQPQVAGAGAVELLASIIESSSDAIVSKNLNGVVTSWNTGATRMFGFTAGEMLGQSITRIIPPDRMEEENGILASIARGEVIDHFDTMRYHKDGRLLPVSVTVSPIRDPAGRIIGASKVARDVTERVKLESILREARDPLSRLVEQAPVSIAMFDFQMRYLAASRYWAEEYGHGCGDLIGRSHYEVVPDIPEVWRDIHRRGLAGEVLRAEEDEWRTANGSVRWVRWAVHPWRTALGDIGGIIIFAEDVTERKEAARQLRESALQFRQLAESLPQLVWACNPAGQCDFLSQQWLAYTGVEAASQLVSGWFEQVHPDDRAELLYIWNRSVATGSEFHGEFRLRRHDGKYRMFDARGTPLKDGQGRIVRWFGVNVDIEDQRRAHESQLRTRKMEALGTLAGGIAHDFNNILLAICGNISLALDDTGVDHPARQSMIEVEKAGVRAVELVRRILAFSRQEEPKRQSLRMREIVEEALKLLRATLPAHIELVTRFAADAPPVLADGNQIHQILVNLLTNAAHAIGTRPGKIEVAIGPVVVDGDYHSLLLASGRYACLSVSDDGCGMSAETRERIFDPFFTTKPTGEGTGLGLSVVDGIMKAHGGAITVYSELGRGTVFKLYFPASEHAVDSDSVRVRTLRSPAEGLRVLYVDDDAALVKLAVRKLTRLGYLASGETQPENALAIFRADPNAFDAVVTDLAMPRMTGLDLARQLLALRPGLPIVLTSGYLRPEDQEAAQAVGIHMMIAKPNTVHELGQVLGEIFGESLGGTCVMP